MRGLGAMSNIEFQNVQALATSLSLNMSELGFKKELEKIRTTFQTAVDNVKGITKSTDTQGSSSYQDYLKSINQQRAL